MRPRNWLVVVGVCLAAAALITWLNVSGKAAAASAPPPPTTAAPPAPDPTFPHGEFALPPPRESSELLATRRGQGNSQFEVRHPGVFVVYVVCDGQGTADLTSPQIPQLHGSVSCDDTPSRTEIHAEPGIVHLSLAAAGGTSWILRVMNGGSL